MKQLIINIHTTQVDRYTAIIGKEFETDIIILQFLSSLHIIFYAVNEAIIIHCWKIICCVKRQEEEDTLRT